MSEERTVAIPVEKYEALCCAAQESAMLRRYLQQKLNSYCTISHNEIENICVMLCIERKVDKYE